METFNERIERFIKINSFYVSRVHTSKDFSLQDSITFNEEEIDKLVFPDGLHLESDSIDEFSDRECYFLVDNFGNYEEIIDRKDFWTAYEEELRFEEEVKKMFA